MPLTGKEALEFHRALRRQAEQERQEQLAKAKSDAASRGKEPFDLAKLEQLGADTTDQGRLDPEDERRARFEEMYYVDYPDIMTLEEFVPHVNELNKWSGR
jgi:hypothetical protein